MSRRAEKLTNLKRDKQSRDLRPIARESLILAIAHKRLLLFLVISLIILIDQVSKAIFAASCNTGIAFGLFGSGGVLNVIVPVTAVLICFYFLLRQERKIVSFGLAFIVGGGASNIIDRLARECVRDFIDLKIWPSFNVADSAVTVGALILIWVLFIKSEPKNYDDTNHRSE